MKTKLNTGYMLLGAVVLFVIVATVSNADVSGSLTYARLKGTGCSETDWGKDYTTPGEITDDRGTNVKDWCQSSKTLIEYSCSADGEIVKESHICTGDYSCEDGACVKGADVCTDSDKGRYVFTFGKVTHLGIDYQDYCEDNIVIAEYYCSPLGEVELTTQNCAYGCASGACIRSTERSALTV